MPRNIEVKARVADILAFDALKKQALELSFEWDKLHQTDTFYESKSGRVKVRESSSESETWCELIWYDRSDSEGPKCSNYHITSIAPKDVLALKHTLRNACGGEQCVVKKTRHVYLVGQTRVHCDEVDELGYFAELEVVLTPRQNEQDGIQIAQTLATRLRLTDFVKGAYADLLPRKQEQPNNMAGEYCKNDGCFSREADCDQHKTQPMEIAERTNEKWVYLLVRETHKRHRVFWFRTLEGATSKKQELELNRRKAHGVRIYRVEEGQECDIDEC